VVVQHIGCITENAGKLSGGNLWGTTMVDNLLYVKKCPECGSTNLFVNRDKGEIICRDCGIVVEDKMVEFDQEWRDFDSEGGEEDGRRRTGAPMTYTQYDKGLGTEVGQKADLLQLASKDRNKFFRLRKWQYRISTAIERNLKLALAELKRVSSFLKLPRMVEEEAAMIYTQAVQRGLVRGRSMESVVAGALYAACRRHEVPRTLDELSEASGIEKKEIGRTYRFVTRELGIKILPSNPADYIARFASSLKLTAETQSKAVEILEKAQLSELTSGRGPTGIAAASLYVSALIHGEKRTQREVADVAGVTEVTIRNRYKELLEKLKLDKEIKKQKKKR
jgi:transcription initiation factor TFIIB